MSLGRPSALQTGCFFFSSFASRVPRPCLPLHASDSSYITASRRLFRHRSLRILSALPPPTPTYNSALHVAHRLSTPRSHPARLFHTRALRLRGGGMEQHEQQYPQDARSKRKSNPVENGERSTKRMKPGTPDSISREPSPRPGSVMDTDLPMADDDIVHAGKSTVHVEDKAWQATIEKVVMNVVSIHFCQTASFDTDGAIASEATGFVVDVERGYILTNRHVVCAGPFWGYCIFDNHEEVHAPLVCPIRQFKN